MAKKKNKNKVSKSVAVKDQQLGKKKETAREKMIGQSIGYRYDVNLLPDYTKICLLYTSPSPRDGLLSRMPSSA